jgi:hypothetical protein
MYTEEVTYDYNILDNGIIQQRRITKVMKDGVKISTNYHRRAIDPAKENVDNEPLLTKALCKTLMTFKEDTYISALEDAKEDGVITKEEKKSLWAQFKHYWR